MRSPNWMTNHKPKPIVLDDVDHRTDHFIAMIPIKRLIDKHPSLERWCFNGDELNGVFLAEPSNIK